MSLFGQPQQSGSAAGAGRGTGGLFGGASSTSTSAANTPAPVTAASSFSFGGSVPATSTVTTTSRAQQPYLFAPGTLGASTSSTTTTTSGGLFGTRQIVTSTTTVPNQPSATPPVTSPTTSLVVPCTTPIRSIFAMTMGSETIKVLVGPDSDPTKQNSYHLHKSKLESNSEYFQRLFSFDGAEVQHNEVLLDEGFEGLEAAFDAFVEYIYTRNYSGAGLIPATVSGNTQMGDSAELDAAVLVLAERLVATELKKKAMASLELKLNVRRPVRSVESICEIIATIYDGTHRPYEAANSSFALFKGSSDGSKAGNTKPWSEEVRQELRKQQTMDPSSYKNCKARKVVTRHVAQYLAKYRGYRAFRECVSEIGDFAMDLIMEPVTMGDSALCVVAD
ncbi:hypothetical protein BJ508DRAFT_363832 [Ascobolus immersus RN42]|uniref:BTB domain-containing protein n=1 Tax=Ascobolus immersus RN42 TaxID=1160509 RepID=A0A3N4I9J1_ASCIM|nr:hypothetical protein BJ508DRAFT_363832 [Ascobolus immersus RN42]